MKRKAMTIPIIIVSLLISALAYARNDRDFYHAIQYGANAKMTIKVVDDINQPVEGAKIDAYFDSAFSAPGEVKSYSTDTNGISKILGKTGKSVKLKVTKPGFYGSTTEVGYVAMGHGVKGNKWLPWNMSKTMLLRPVKNPVATKVAIGKWRVADATYQWLGFDLEKYDFIAPHGQGVVADMEIKFDYNGQRSQQNYAGIDLYICFPMKYAGGYYHDRVMESDFKDAYQASTNATYLQNFHFYEYPVRDNSGEIKRYEQSEFDPSKVLIIRSRCVLDENGKLKEARYSQISNLRFSCEDNGPCIMLRTIFNATPNDTNLEPK